MITVYLCILAVFIVLIVLSAGEKLTETDKKSFVEKPFRKMAVYLLRKFRLRKRRRENRACWKQEVYERQLGEKLKKLQPSGSFTRQLDAFQTARYGTMLLVLFYGNLLCLFLWAGTRANSLLMEGAALQRNEYGKGKIPVILSARIEGAEEEEIVEYVVEERKFSEEEIEDMYEEVIKTLPDIIRGENKDIAEIRSNLNLVTQIDGYPFHISWDSGSYKRVNTDGDIDNEFLTENEIVMLTAHFVYENWMRDFVCYVQVCPAVYTEKELRRKNLEKAIAVQEEATRSSTRMELPGQMGDSRISWQEVTQDRSGYLFVLIVVASGLVYWGKERDVEQKMEARRKQLLLDYPEIVNKLVLYMGAGMTIRNAFLKMGEDYKRQSGAGRRYAYEEILQTCHELQSGNSEMEVYDNFGRRCHIQSYIKLGALLSQNVRKGSNDLLSMLGKEAQEAFAERKSLAKKLGEEAGTKLLMPMMIMLCIVMIIIMIPAYFSFML